MIIPDINLLLHAHNSAYRRHRSAREWWETLLNGTGSVGLPWVSILGFIRVAYAPEDTRESPRLGWRMHAYPVLACSPADDSHPPRSSPCGHSVRSPRGGGRWGQFDDGRAPRRLGDRASGRTPLDRRGYGAISGSAVGEPTCLISCSHSTVAVFGWRRTRHLFSIDTEADLLQAAKCVAVPKIRP